MANRQGPSSKMLQLGIRVRLRLFPGKIDQGTPRLMRQRIIARNLASGKRREIRAKRRRARRFRTSRCGEIEAALRESPARLRDLGIEGGQALAIARFEPRKIGIHQEPPGTRTKGRRRIVTMTDPFATPMALTCPDLPAFEALAARLAARLRPGDVVALGGALGTGKTTFVRAVVQTLHGVDAASSPTFTFRHRYEPPRPGGLAIEHLDLYRLGSERELAELGLEEAFDGAALVLVEWWERAPSLLPERRYDVRIDGIGEQPRSVTVRPPA